MLQQLRSLLKKKERPYTAAVVAAGGSARRMEGVDKLLAEIHGVPVIAYTLLALEKSSCVDEIVVAASDGNFLPITEVCREFGISKVFKVVRGGQERADSVYKALCECSPQTKFVLVQDGARPLLTPDLAEKVCQKAYEARCATAAVPVKDTIKVVENGLVQQTPDRAFLYAVQTPQVTDIDLLKGALCKAAQDGEKVTDDCAAVEKLGIRPAIVMGSYDNIKITTPEDLDIAQVLLERMGTEQGRNNL